MSDARRWSRREVLAGFAGGAALAAGATAGVPGLFDSAPPAGAAPVGSGATVTGAVQVDLTSLRGALGPGSMGFSFERRTLGLPLFQADNQALVALFRLLGRGVLRLGADSVESTPWAPSGAGGSVAQVAPPDLARLRSFLDAVDWEVIYGTPFLNGTAGSVADEVSVAAAALGSRLVGVELCNEPDLYQTSPSADPVAGPFPLFLARWQSFAAAARAATPGVPLAGPADFFLGTIGGRLKSFLHAEGSGLRVVTQHYYRGYGIGPQTIEVLLAPDPALDAALAKLAAASGEHGIGYRLGETNSFAHGGQAGVSNTQASALWGVDLLARAAAGGAAGVNLHNSGAGAGYPAIVQVDGQVTEIRPLFAGLLLGAQMARGTMVATSVDPALVGVRAHAVRADDGTATVLVVNAGATTAADLTLDLGAAVAGATSVALTGPGLAATDGVVVRGAAVGVDGSWDPEPPSTLAVSGRHVDVTVPAASAVVIEVTLVASTPPTTPMTPTSSTALPGPSGTADTSALPATPVVAAPTLTG